MILLSRVVYGTSFIIVDYNSTSKKAKVLYTEHSGYPVDTEHTGLNINAFKSLKQIKDTIYLDPDRYPLKNLKILMKFQ